MRPYKVIRFIDFNYLFELFFLSAILSIIGIRLYLQLTGFPQIGSGDFHIAHTLFGGLFMLGSLFGFMTFLNDDFKPLWAVLGGLGFGTFIDELGKFITSDNNYFYQPTFAIIYIIFVSLYLFYKSIEHVRIFSQDEFLINSAEILKEVIIHDVDKEEKTKALHYLSMSNQHDKVTKFLTKVFTEIEPQEEQPGVYSRIKNALANWYHFLLAQPWFLNAVSVFFLLRSLIYVFNGLVGITFLFGLFTSGAPILQNVDVLPLIRSGAVIVQAILTIIGAFILFESRKRAFVFFKIALYVSILILQVFNFYSDPATALLSTTVDVVLLSIVNYMIDRENQRKMISN
jgi:hypothetical protein